MAGAEGRKPDRSVISWRRMISMPILLISWRQLPTRPKLADPFDMSQLSEDAAVRRLGDRLGFGLSGNALIEAQQRRLTATLKPYLSLPLTATPEPNRHHTAAAVDSTPAQCGRR
jgi:hypothetical protein